jgi:hypothetical protein
MAAKSMNPLYERKTSEKRDSVQKISLYLPLCTHFKRFLSIFHCAHTSSNSLNPLNYLRTGDMDEIGFEFFHNGRSLHFRQIKRQGDLIVERKGKALRVTNGKSKGFFGQFVRWRFRVHGQNVHFVARLFHKFQHFLEAIGVARNMSKGSRFDHETDSTRRIASQRRSIVRILIVRVFVVQL